jgi:hypothetical protein
MYEKYKFFSKGQILRILAMDSDKGTVMLGTLDTPVMTMVIDHSLASPCETVEKLPYPIKGRPAGTEVFFFLEGREFVGYGADGVELMREKA